MVCGYELPVCLRKKKNLENPDTKTSTVKKWWGIQDQLGTIEIKKPVNRRENLICNSYFSWESTTVLFGFMPLMSDQSKANVKLTCQTSHCPNSWENCFSWALLFFLLQIVVLIKKSCSHVTQPTGSEEEMPNFIITLANSSQRSSPRRSAEHQRCAPGLAACGRMLRGRLLTLCSVSPSSFTMGAFCQRATKNPPWNYKPVRENFPNRKPVSQKSTR